MQCSRCLLDSGEPTSSVAVADVCLGVLESGLELVYAENVINITEDSSSMQ